MPRVTTAALISICSRTWHLSFLLTLETCTLCTTRCRLSLNHRFSHGFNVLFAYTYSSDLGNADGNVAGFIQDSHDPEAEYGPVAPDLRNRFTASYLYELPVGRGRTFASDMGPVLDAVIGGWNIAGITTAQSGESETSTVSTDLSNTGSFSYRFDQIHNPKDFSYDSTDQAALGCTPGQRNILCWYNPAAFTAPPLARGSSRACLWRRPHRQPSRP